MAEINSFINSKSEKQVQQYKQDIADIAKQYGILATNAGKLEKEQAKQASTQKELDNATKAYNSLLKQLNTNAGKLAVAESGLNKEVIRQKEQLRQVNKDLKSNSTLYGTLTNKLEKNRAKAKELGIQYGTNSKKFKTAQANVLKLNNQITKLDASLGQHNRKVGSYTTALGSMGKSLIGSFGVVGGLALFAAGIKDVIKIGKEYEKQNAVLASVLGKTLKETTELQEQSKELGSTTAFSATQVVDLQTNLARLGKTEEEIIDSTEGIIDATLALGSETGETAALVGATLNAFSLEAAESGRVADVLTLSTQRSALSFEKLNTALPIASGAASAAGVSFTTMTAQLGKAADRGIDASTAATSLRNIYISLAEQGITLEDALRKINTSQNKLTTATELFGKRAAVTALALADNVEQTNELDKALQNAGGTAKQVAEVQLNTLDGRLKLLNSAWEGLVININNSETAIGSASNSFISFLTKGINQIANIGKEWELFKLSLVGGWEDASQEVNKYIAETGRIEDSNGNISQVKDVLDDVANSYKNLTFEQQQYVNVNEQMAIALLKAGGEAEAVDGIVREYVKGLNLEKEALNDLNYEYDESGDLLEDQNKNKNELNEITKQSINLADEEIERVKRQIEVYDKLQKKQFDAAFSYNEGEEKKAEFTEQAEESAANLAAKNIEIIQEQQTNDEALQAAREAIQQRKQEQGLANLANVATLASKEGAINKAAALKQALIDGKAAVQSAFKFTPGPLPIKIAAATIAGIVQLKNVKDILATNTQISAFAEGTDSTPSTPWIAGEAGREMMIDSKGNVSMIDTPTLFTNQAGNTILSNSDTEKVLRGNKPSKQIDLSPVVNAIQENASYFNMNFDKRGIYEESRRGGGKTKYINTKFRNKA